MKLVFVVLIAYSEVFKRLLNRSFKIIVISLPEFLVVSEIRRNKKFLVSKDRSDFSVIRIYNCVDVALRKSRRLIFILVDYDVAKGLKNIFYKIINSNHTVSICIAD